MSKIEEWERNSINSLTLKLMFAAALATLAAVAIAYITQKAGMAEVNRELLFLPWGIALVYGVSAGFHKGVLAERQRQEQLASKEDGDDNAEEAAPKAEDEPEDA